MICDNGQNMYSVEIKDIDKEKLNIITKEIIKELSKLPFSVLKNIENCNLDVDSLLDKYFDQIGNIYYKIINNFYLFNLRITKLSKYFKKI